MAQDPSRPIQKHPDEWEADLNPDFLAGQNTGVGAPQPEKTGVTAYDFKELHQQLASFSSDDLKQIPLMPAGSRLKQGATYIDLRDPQRREFTATNAMITGPNDLYVPKSEVDYQLWNRLIGVANPERRGEANEGS
jgi:hypothetical protein